MTETQQFTDPVRVLDTAECWRLLAEQEFGRLAMRDGEGVDIFPVNYLVHDSAIYFRSGPGAKLVDLTRHPGVAFEVDGQLAHRVWSVVISGAATRIGSDAEIHASGIQGLQTWHPSDKFNYVCLRPASVTGRSFAKR
jgi:nitroimidazol reductase NimA-like FMN-containing flavoprotein (pyridoxamine 5'-phosphate oxidase superfamily)